MDFGIARVLGTSRMTKQGNIVGTIAYMSPEQVRGQETDARSDIYSLGILLYEMLTGRVPFFSDSEYDLMKMQIEAAPDPPRVFAAHITPAVEQAVMRSLAKRIEARFQGAAEFRNALLSAAGPLTAPPPAPLIKPEATQLIGTPVVPPSSSAGPGAPGETRLVSPVSQPQFDQLKQTRLAPQANQQYPYPAAQPMPATYQPAPYQQPAASKSNAKIFLGIAAAVIIVLVGAAAALLVLQKKPAPPATVAPSSSQPPQTESAVPGPTAPNAGAGQPPIVAPPPSQSTPPVELTKPVGGELSAGTAPVGGGNAGSSRSTKQAKKESNAEAAARKEKERKAAEARRLLNQ
jgi:serine/threonine-protein kinase